MKSTTLTISLLFLFSISFSQIRFNKRYNFYTNASCIASILATDSCYYISGIATDTINPTLNIGNLISKIDLNGNIVWRKINYGGYPRIATWCNTLNNFNNQFILSGNIDNPNFPLGRRQFGIFFINHAGEFNKINRFSFDTLQHTGDSVQFRFSDNNQMLNLGNDKILIAIGAGFIDSTIFSVGTAKLYVMKVDTSGGVIWKKIYGDNIYQNDMPRLLIKNNAEYLIGYWYNSGNLDLDCSLCRVKILKIDSAGNNESIVYTSPNNIMQVAIEDFVHTNDGGYCYTSNLGTTTSIPHDYYYQGLVVKLDSNFNEQWRYISPGDSSTVGLDRMNSVIELSDGSIVALGAEFLPPPLADSIYHFMSLVKLSQLGQVKWHRIFYSILFLRLKQITGLM